MAYTPQTIHKGDRSGGVSVQDPSALATALENIDTAIAAAGDVSQTTTSFGGDTGGSSTATTLTSTVGISNITIPITNAKIADGDLVTEYTPGFKFKLIAFDYITGDPVTTASKASTITLEAGTGNVTGGVISLTSAAMTPIGAVIEGTAITGNNTGSATDTISIEAASTTTFIEGDGMFVITIQNMDVADSILTIATQVNNLITDDASIIAALA